MKRLGKLPAASDPAVPALRDVLGATGVPAVWPDADWRGGVYGERIMGDNDWVGDCVVVACANGVLTQSSSALKPSRMSDDECLAAYIAATDPPYDPLTRTNDSGIVIASYLRHWCQSGVTIGGKLDKLIGYASVHPTDRVMVRQAIGLGGGVLIGAQLPVIAQAQISAGNPWVAGRLTDTNAAPGSWGGHGMWALSADPYGVWVVTWGELQRLEWSAWDDWVDECYLCISPTFLDAKGFDPASVNLAAIQAAMPLATT